MWKSFLKHLKRHGWTWLAGLVIGVLVALLAPALARLSAAIRKPHEQESNAYVFTSDLCPLANGEVRNSFGEPVSIDERGCFKPRAEWSSGAGLMIYGPIQYGSERRYLGEHVLRARLNGEWEPIRLTVTSQEIAAAPAPNSGSDRKQ